MRSRGHSKKEIRIKILQELMSLSKSTRQELSAQLSKNLLLLLERLSLSSSLLTKNLASFAPMSTEPDWFMAFDEEAEKLNLFLPTLKNDFEMEFKEASWTDLREGKVHWRTQSQNKGLDNLEIILVPGLAFTKEGKRLGRGKGYYDRFLEKSSAVKIGICFESQIQDEIPVNDKDIMMDYIVTNQRYIICKGEK